MAQTALVGATGCEAFFDQLVDPVRAFTDESPPWLHRLVECALNHTPADRRDWMVLEAALKGLDAITSGLAHGRIDRAA